MTFSRQFNQLPLSDWNHHAAQATHEEVLEVLQRGPSAILDFATLISPAALGSIELLARKSQEITRHRFGRVVRLFAPLYLSNECINNCKYCGFSRDNSILRVTLSIDEVEREARMLYEQGFRHVLLVAGEHPKFVSNGYLQDCVRILKPIFPSISLEVGPMETADYVPVVEAGAEGLVVYQETYDRTVYAEMHTAGPKRDFDWRLDTPDRAYHAGFRRLGIGALFGMGNWRSELLSVAAHCQYLLRQCWKAQLTVSLPRLRPCAGEFEPLTIMRDEELALAICALRIFLPDVGLVLSTREPAWLRDGLIPLGVTLISAGSHTEPGGYTGAGQERLHVTQRGRILPLAAEQLAMHSPGTTIQATGQFEIADTRSPKAIADVLSKLGYEAVWKDWDAELAGRPML